MKRDETKICVIGIWHLGSVTSVCMADYGFQVVGVDRNLETVDNLNAGIPPLFEPGLEELLSRNLQAGRLRYTTDLGVAVKGASLVWLTFDTPVDDNDEVDLSEIFAVARDMAPYLEERVIVLVSSQVPVGTCEQIDAIIQQTNPDADFGIAYSPENLRLGRAIERFQNPAVTIPGSNDAATLDRVEELLQDINSPKLRMNLRTAEMTKHAINAFLATSISFANELANLCDAVGADALRLAAALRMDERIGPKARVLPGLGFSGGTLARDMKVLSHLGEQHAYDAHLVRAVLKVNVFQNQWVGRRLRQVLGSLQGLSVSVLGLTYTPNTSTLRRSVAIEIIRDLVAGGATVKAYDPKADREEVAQHVEFEFVPDPYLVTSDSDCLVVVTEWPVFKTLDFGRIKSLMRRPLVIDPKNFLDAEQLIELGFEYLGVGRGYFSVSKERTGR